MADAPLTIGAFEFQSRLFTGTGKYSDLDTAEQALRASGCEVVTVAVRRVDLGARDGRSILSVLRDGGYTILPNTAGCYTAEDAVRAARLAREMLDTPLVKLEVIGDEKTLFPDVPATLESAKTLVDHHPEAIEIMTDRLSPWKPEVIRSSAACTHRTNRTSKT